MRIDIKYHTNKVSVMFDDSLLEFNLTGLQAIKDADDSIDTIKDALIVALCRNTVRNDAPVEVEGEEPIEFIACDSDICKYCALYYHKKDQDDQDDCDVCQSYTGHQYFIGIECFRTLGD